MNLYKNYLISQTQASLKWENDLQRRAYAALCLDYYRNNVQPHLEHKLDQLLTKEEDRRELKKYIDHENLTEFIINEASLVFHEPPKISLSIPELTAVETEVWQKKLNRILEECHFHIVLRETEKLVNVVKDCIVYPHLTKTGIKLQLITPDNAFVHQHTQDPTQCRRFFYAFPQDTQTASPSFFDCYHFWGDYPEKKADFGHYLCRVGLNGQILEIEPAKNIYPDEIYFSLTQHFPFVAFRNYLPLTDFWFAGKQDLVEKNITLDLRLTDLQKALAYNIPQLFTRGFPEDQPLIKSRSAHINLPINEMMPDVAQPDAKYLHPNESIKEMYEIIKDMTVNLARKKGISPASIKGESFSSGYHLALSMWQCIKNSRMQRLYYVQPIKELLRKIITIHNLINEPFPVGTDFKIDFAEINFPESRKEQAEADALEKTNGCLSTPRIIMRNNPDLCSEEALELAKIMAKEDLSIL